MTTTTYTPAQIAGICDHTFLKRTEAYAGKGDNPVRRRQEEFFAFLADACQRPLKPYAICVRAEDVPHAAPFLEAHGGGEITLVATVGFPEGGWYDTRYKVFEAEYAMSAGAQELDMVLNYQGLKAGEYGPVLAEIADVLKVVRRYGGKLKVIVETSELTQGQIATACALAQQAGVDFVKTSTGFASGGAEEAKLAILCEHFKGGIKISGGVNAHNVHRLLATVASTRPQGFSLDPSRVRVGASKLLDQLLVREGELS